MHKKEAPRKVKTTTFTYFFCMAESSHEPQSSNSKLHCKFFFIYIYGKSQIPNSTHTASHSPFGEPPKPPALKAPTPSSVFSPPHSPFPASKVKEQKLTNANSTRRQWLSHEVGASKQ